MLKQTTDTAGQIDGTVKQTHPALHSIPFILLPLLLIVLNTNLYAVVDTLRHYNPAAIGTSYNVAAGTKQYARFVPKAPGYAKTIIVTLGGADSTGNATVYLYGHEGGRAYPTLEQNLITPLIINKTKSGIERVAINLNMPVWLDNNQFFVGIGGLSSGITLIKDAENHPPACSSATDGIYYYVCLKTSGGGISYGANAYAIDVIMDYPDGITSPQYFQDVTAASGIGTVSAVFAWSDINNDGYMDLLAGGKLYKNNKDGTFTDITASAGITASCRYSTFIDMNNDGKDDMLFFNWWTNPIPSILYINNGDETFTGYPGVLPVPISGEVAGISVADINNDKYPDLFIGELWLFYPTPEPNYFFLNDKKLGFINSTALIYPNGSPNRRTRGSSWTDYNNDCKLDLYVSNYYLERDELWQNNGNGPFTNVINSKGIDINNQGGSGHGTGCDWADYDNDGDMDLLLPQLAHPEFILAYNHRPTTLYKNTGAPSYNFTDMNPVPNTGNLGIQYEETHAGATWGDVNRDGLTDVFITTFYNCRYGDLYLQKPDHTFELKSFDYGVQNMTSWFGQTIDAALVDFDNDGYLDLSVGVQPTVDSPAYFRLFRNNLINTNSYLELNLISVSGNTQAIGAKVEVYAGGNKYTQYQIPGHGADMYKSNRLFFGLGSAATIDSVVVGWPNGVCNAESFSGINVNSIDTLVEGTGTILEVGTSDVLTVLSMLSIYPIPAADEVTVIIVTKQNTPATIEIFNAMGQKAYDKAISLQKGKTAIKVPVSHLATGAYVFRVALPSGEQDKKVFVQ